MAQLALSKGYKSVRHQIADAPETAVEGGRREAAGIRRDDYQTSKAENPGFLV